MYLAQGKSLKNVIILTNSYFVAEKLAKNLEIGDKISLPTAQLSTPVATNQAACLATLSGKKENNFVFTTNDGKQHLLAVNHKDSWQVFPAVNSLGERSFAKNSINAFLVNASRADNTIVITDSTEHFQKSIDINRNAKLSAFEKLATNWPELLQKVQAMTAHVCGIIEQKKPTNHQQSQEKLTRNTHKIKRNIATKAPKKMK